MGYFAFSGKRGTVQVVDISRWNDDVDASGKGILNGFTGKLKILDRVIPSLRMIGGI